mgnify:CR=1 FL=1
MSYTKVTDFASKDALLSGNPAKLVKGVEIDDEFNAIQVADALNVKTADIGVTVQAYSANLAEYAAVNPTAAGLAILDDADAAAQRATLGAQAYSANLDEYAAVNPTAAGLALLDGADASAQRTTLGLVIGTDIQAYDANTAKLDVDQSWTGAQRGTPTTDNDLSFDLAAANNFTCTPSAGGTLTFTNITAGQSGFILLVNGSNYTISAAATTKIKAASLTTISATGTYLLGYFSNGTNVYVTASSNLA